VHNIPPHSPSHTLSLYPPTPTDAQRGHISVQHLTGHSDREEGCPLRTSLLSTSVHGQPPLDPAEKMVEKSTLLVTSNLPESPMSPPAAICLANRPGPASRREVLLNSDPILESYCTRTRDFPERGPGLRWLLCPEQSGTVLPCPSPAEDRHVN
jgi:hypothetical protein